VESERLSHARRRDHARSLKKLITVV